MQLGGLVEDVNWEPREHPTHPVTHCPPVPMLCKLGLTHVALLWVGFVDPIEGRLVLVESGHLEFFSSLPLPLDLECGGSLVGLTAGEALLL